MKMFKSMTLQEAKNLYKALLKDRNRIKNTQCSYGKKEDTFLLDSTLVDLKFYTKNFTQDY